jgi:hypothetical protein
MSNDLGGRLSMRERPHSMRLIQDPIIIVGNPRSGTSSLFAALFSHPGLWSLHSESLPVLDGPLHPRHRGWESHVATESDLDPVLAAQLEGEFFRRAGNLERVPLGRFVPLKGRGKESATHAISLVSRPWKRVPVRLVEKTIPNILRIRFLKALFPDARFVHLVRHPRQNIAAMYRGWRQEKWHHDFPLPDGFEIRGHLGRYWSFVLPPGWKSQHQRTLMEVCAFQWASCHRRCLDDSAGLDPSSYIRIHWEDLVADPAEALGALAKWAELDPKPFERFARGLPRINYRKDSTKQDVPWGEVEAVLPQVTDVSEQFGYE